MSTIPTTIQIKAMQEQLLRNGRADAIHDGLTDSEIEAIQAKYKFKFPEDLRQFLQVGLPVSHGCKPGVPEELPAFYSAANRGWHDWRTLLIITDPEKDTVLNQLSYHATPPDVEKGSYPPLIPIYIHRMIPTEPSQRGNPVLSMHGCYDNIVYGSNLWDWLVQDFSIEVPTEFTQGGTPYKELPFWNKYLE